MNLKVAFLPLYNRSGPSSRYRVFQFLEPLRQAGIHCQVLPAPQRRPGKRPAYLPRLFWTARSHDLLFIQKRLFSAWVLSALVRLNPRLVYDFDDAIYLQPGREPALRRMLKQASGVTAGNAALAEYARRFSPAVSELPTVVDHEYYRPASSQSQDPGDGLVLSWIGISPHRADFDPLRPALKALSARLGERIALRFVAAGPPAWLAELDWEFVRWSMTGALEQMQRFHIGLTPLAPTPWNAGKCGLKLLQYMAVGLPAVASPAGANRQIVVDGQTGFLAETPAEWQAALERLAVSPALRARLGAAGRERLAAHYSVQAVLPRLVDIVGRAAQVGR